jgi:hypothetical protein
MPVGKTAGKLGSAWAYLFSQTGEAEVAGCLFAAERTYGVIATDTVLLVSPSIVIVSG